MLKDAALRRGLAWLVAALLYAVWPFDLIPDWAVFLGWADDLVVVGVAGYFFWRRYQDYLDRKAAAAMPEDTLAEDEDPHFVLGVPRGASPDEVKAAYRRAMAEYHPDKVAHLGRDLRLLAERKAKAIRRAYERLSGGPV